MENLLEKLPEAEKKRYKRCLALKKRWIPTKSTDGWMMYHCGHQLSMAHLTHYFHDNGPKDVAEAVSSSDDSKTYCFCGKDKKGMMIACENPECIVEWYHYSCIGIKRKPKGSWFCPKCKYLLAI